MNKWPWICAAVLFALTTWLSEGHHQGDEHFQILEYAGYKLGLAETEDLAWEFHERMRPALQPAMAWVAYKTIGLGGRADPFVVAFFLRLLSAAFTLLIARFLYIRYAPLLRPPLVRVFLLALLFHWCAYYQGVRFSSENWSGLTFIAGLLTYPLSNAGAPRRFTPAGGKSAFLAGVLFGFSFLLRYQMAIAVGGFGLWLIFIGRERLSRLLATVGGGLLAIAVCYPLSYWLYGEWTLPAWNYLASNLIEGKAAGYGTRPWYAYLELVFLRGIPPLGLIYVLAFLAFAWWYRRDPLTWASVAFVVVHSALARKDIRFLFPFIPLLPVYVAGCTLILRERFGEFWQRRGWRAALWVTLALNLVLLASVVVRPASMEIDPSRYVYYHYPDGVRLVGPDARIVTAEGTVSRFYHRPNVFVGDENSDSSSLPVLWLSRSRETPDAPADARLLYSNRPGWLEPFNVGGWMDRQKWWYIYALPDG